MSGRQLQLDLESILAAPRSSAPAKSAAKSAAELAREVAEFLATPDPDKVAAYEEKLEAKRDRLEAASAKHAARSRSSYASAKARGDMIPFGQPILRGHHSERRHRSDIAKIDASMRKSFAEADRAGELARAAERVGTAGISSDDPAAVKKIKAEIADLEKNQEGMKAANKAIKKHEKGGEVAQLAALAALGYPDARARKLLTKDFAGRIGFPDYAIKNNGANIRRLEKRIAELTSKAITPARAVTRGSLPDGMTFSISEDKDKNRTQIVFSGKPDEATRTRLKSAGFRWAPSEGAWQRQMSNGAWHQAHSALGLEAR